MHGTMQMRSIRARVEQATVIALTREALAQIREPEPASAIEHDIVRTAEPLAVERFVDALEATSGKIDALDAAGHVVRRAAHRHEKSTHLAPLEAAVVAHVDRTVRSDRCAVRAAAEVGNDFRAPVPVS